MFAKEFNCKEKRARYVAIAYANFELWIVYTYL